MTDLEHLNMMLKQFHHTKNPETRKQLYKAIHRLDKKMKQKKTGMVEKDGVYYSKS